MTAEDDPTDDATDDVGGGDADDQEQAQAPTEQAQAAFEDAVEQLQAVDQDDRIARAQTCSDVGEMFTDALADAVVAGLPKTQQTLYYGEFADVSTFTKTSIREEVAEKVTKRTQLNQASENGSHDGGEAGDGSQDSAEGYAMLSAFLHDHVERIDAVRSTDAKQSTAYSWWINVPGTDGETFNIQTGAADEARDSHYHWPALRSAIFDAGGVWTSAPPKDVRQNWSEVIGEFIDKRVEHVTHKGPRTCALESLQNYIRRVEAYPTVEDMITHQGVRLDDDPDEGDPSEIWIPNTQVSNICEDHAITERGLQIELDTKGHTPTHRNGVSESTFVDGDKVTYWVVNADFAHPRDYTENPETHAERATRTLDEDRAAANGNGTGGGGTHSADGTGTDDDEPEPGQIGSVGTDTDDPDAATDGGDDGDE